MSTSTYVGVKSHDANIGMMPRSTKYRLYPDSLQVEVLTAQGHAARACWNLLHEWWTGHNTFPSLGEADAAIRQGRKDLDWLRVLPAQAAQAILKTYHQAWRACWGGVRDAPVFHDRYRTRLAVDVPQARDLKPLKLSRRYGTVQLPGVGRVKVRTHTPYPERMSGARVVREANGWFLVVRGWVPEPVIVEREPSVEAIDRGIVLPGACSDGSVFTHKPYLSGGEAERKRRLERKAARQRDSLKARRKALPLGTPIEEQPVPSKRYKRTLAQIAALSARAARRRADFNHKTSRVLADRHTVVVLEELNIKSMTKRAAPIPDPDHPGQYLPNHGAAKSGLNRAILNEAWGQLGTFLNYKTREKGGVVIRVPAAYSSQECHKCGSTARKQRENQASFVCANPTCGWSGNADYNAALVLRARGLAHLANQGAAAGSVVAGRGAQTTPRGRRGRKRQTLVSASDYLKESD